MPAPPVADRGRPATATRSRKAGENPYRAASIGDLVSLTAIPESEGQDDNFLRKTGSRPKLVPMTNPRLPHEARPSALGFSRQGEREKIFQRKIRVTH